MYFKKFEIHNFLCNKEGNLTLFNLVNMMIETSGEESNKNNMGFKDLLKMNYYWMIHKWKIEINKTIPKNSCIKIYTWPSKFDKLNCYREFKVCDKDDNILAIATAIFVIVDINKLKPVLVNENIKNSFKLYDKLNFDLIERIEVSKELIKLDTFKIRNYDIDENNHVNNSVYIKWIEDIINKKIYKLNLIYNKELRNKDFIYVYGNKQLNYIEIQSDEGVNFRANIEFLDY